MGEAQARTGQGAGAGAPGAAVDDDALALAAHRDREAFAELYRRHLERVYRYLLARVSDVPLAQDLTAQTFLAALEGISQYRGQGQFAGWLLGIARNKAADHFRRSRSSVSLDAVQELPHPGLSPDQAAAEHLQMERVAGALRALAPDRAEALALRVFAGLSAEETARVMGKSEAAVKMLVHRALHDLQARLGSLDEAEP